MQTHASAPHQQDMLFRHGVEPVVNRIDTTYSRMVTEVANVAVVSTGRIVSNGGGNAGELGDYLCYGRFAVVYSLLRLLLCVGLSSLLSPGLHRDPVESVGKPVRPCWQRCLSCGISPFDIRISSGGMWTATNEIGEFALAVLCCVPGDEAVKLGDVLSRGHSEARK